MIPTKSATETSAPITIGQALLDRAFIEKSPDALADVLKQLGPDKAKANELAAQYGLRGFDDYRTRGVRPEKVETKTEKGEPEKKPETSVSNSKDNTWSADGWNISRQGACARSMGLAKAASLAASAGSRIRATKPSRAA